MVVTHMSPKNKRFSIGGKVDIRLTVVSFFLLFLTVWHLLEGTLFPDAVFFAIVTVITLWLAVIGLGGEEGFEIGEGEGG